MKIAVDITHRRGGGEAYCYILKQPITYPNSIITFVL
jgi:hypothetical protein